MTQNDKTPEQIEMEWFRNVYQGNQMAQLTRRALVMGSFLGAIMCLSNLYVGLKTGWALGIAITACILSYAINKTLSSTFPKAFGAPMSILENNCMQSTASAAGYSTGSTMVSAISAYLMITNHHIPFGILVAFVFCTAALGVFMAIPMKRQMINVEQLRFPSGIAAAETLKSLHHAGDGASKKARYLTYGGIFGAVVTWLRDIGKPFQIPGSLPILPGGLNGIPFTKWTVNFEMSGIMVAAGAIMGWRPAWSMLLGGFLNYFVFAPQMARVGAIDLSHIGYRAIMTWSTWAGAGIMVSSGLVVFLFQWKTVVRAMSGFTRMFSNEKPKEDALAAIEVPTSWFLIGMILSGLGCMIVLKLAFNTHLWMGAVAVILTFLLAMVACRATGETDTTPIGAMGKITQLLFGFLAPSNMTTNLMTASVTANAAASAADLLTDLKSGYMLGANPRKQFIAQFVGIFAGTAIIIPAFYVLVPDASVLGTDRWPAPSAQVWAAVAKLLSNGIHALHPAARMGLYVGLLVGIVLPILELLFPKARKFIPSAMGLGLAFVIPFFNSLSIFLGALIALILEKRRPDLAEEYIIPVSSGVIAGESLLGIVVALMTASGVV